MSAAPRLPSVMIVEDERIVALDLQQSLRDLGYDAFAIASSAEEAIRQATDRCPDLVLMDIRIKGVRDGIETADILRRQFGIAIVYLTAYASTTIVERAKVTEPLGYLLKPVKPRELRGVVEIALHRHSVEKGLRERERWFSTTMHSIADAVVAVDLAGMVTYINAAAESLIGLKAEEAVGQPVNEVMRLADQRPLSNDSTPLAGALRTRNPVDLTEANIVSHATGAKRAINNRAAPVFDQGSMLGAVMVFRDITEKKKLQRQLELADRLTSLGTMAAGVVHELNNPLAVLVANAGFVDQELKKHLTELNSPAGPEISEQRLDGISAALGDLHSAAARMGRIVAGLRSFSRPAEDAPEVIELKSSIDAAMRATSHEFQHRARVVTCLGVTPAVFADEGRLVQVLVNLLINASHAIDPGHADRNEVSLTTRTGANGWALLEVRDSGAGIPPEVLKRIFEPFFTTKEVGVGTGLGLSICHGIILAMGGEISVDSKPGKGTTFSIALPPAPAARVAARIDASKPAAAQAQRGRILVVDDEEMIRGVLKRVLKDGGHEVTCLSCAQEALDLIEGGESFDVILSDLMMPTMTGMQFFAALSGTHPQIASRVAFLSAGAVTEQAEAFLQSVPNRRLEKPFKLAALNGLVQHVLADQRTPGSAIAH